MKHGGFVYIITNQYNTVLYTGVNQNYEQEFLSIKQNSILKALRQSSIAIKLFGLNFFLT